MSRNKSVLFFLLFFAVIQCSYAQSALYPKNGTLFDGKLHKVEILMPWSDYEEMVHPDNIWTNKRYEVTFIYDDLDTVKKSTVRIKGNTSRSSAKKSFRIDFDKIIDDQTYQGLETIYLHGNHNDASMMREYLSVHVMQNMGVTCNRANHARLYINGEYFGIRSMVEYMDRDFLKTRFGSNKGNNYKCTWPADLVWLGNQQIVYKNVINPSPERERAYDLKTNEDEDDYTRFVLLLDVINNHKDDPNFKSQIEQIFNVNHFLKALAAEVLVGHWDNYYYNKNNYFIYDHPTTKKFVYMPYDMDNTFGVEWNVGNIDVRNIHEWGNPQVSAPLAESILAVNEYKQQYESYLFNAVNSFYTEEKMHALVDSLNNKLAYWIGLDPQYTGKHQSTYGYTVDDWKTIQTQGLDDHNSFGLKEFITNRINSIENQWIYEHVNGLNEFKSLVLHPNPATDFIVVGNLREGSFFQVYTTDGTLRMEGKYEGKIEIKSLPPGPYILLSGNLRCVWFKKN